MRINIKTNGPVKDKDLRALHMFNAAIKMSTPRMLKANLEFMGLSMADVDRVTKLNRQP